jgi:DTW domain-containing protein YfiP
VFRADHKIIKKIVDLFQDEPNAFRCKFCFQLVKICLCTLIQSAKNQEEKGYAEILVVLVAFNLAQQTTDKIIGC